MATWRYHKDRIGNHKLHPETLMLGYGYEPGLSEGAVKAPVFLTSTFVFRSAEEGQDFFDYVSGRRKPPAGDEAGLVYSRFNHPNSEIVEDRLAIFEEAETGVVFSSGMSAIATTLLAYIRPGDVILHSQPLYGGTESLLAQTLQSLGVTSQGFVDGVNGDSVRRAAEDACRKGRVPIILVESPSNPLNTMVDLVARSCRVRGDRAKAERTAAADRLRQHAAWTDLSEAVAPRHRHRHLLADEICRRPFGSRRRRGAGEPGRAAADPAAARRDRDAA